MTTKRCIGQILCHEKYMDNGKRLWIMSRCVTRTPLQCYFKSHISLQRFVDEKKTTSLLVFKGKFIKMLNLMKIIAKSPWKNHWKIQHSVWENHARVIRFYRKVSQFLIFNPSLNKWLSSKLVNILVLNFYVILLSILKTILQSPIVIFFFSKDNSLKVFVFKLRDLKANFTLIHEIWVLMINCNFL